MKRREFIAGTLGVLATGCAPVRGRRRRPRPKQITAIEFLTKSYNDASKGTGWQHAPKVLHVSESLWNAYLSEIVCCQRFTSQEETEWLPEPALAFKACKMYKRDFKTKSWFVVFLGGSDPDGKAYDLSYWQS